jgi:hypothetical protein
MWDILIVKSVDGHQILDYSAVLENDGKAYMLYI